MAQGNGQYARQANIARLFVRSQCGAIETASHILSEGPVLQHRIGDDREIRVGYASDCHGLRLPER